MLYVWKPDAEYVLASDRSQNTRMVFNYNQFPGQPIGVQEALLTGPAPQGIQPPQNSATSFLINYNTDGTQACHGSADGFDFPQEPPNWVSKPGVQGTLRATITNNAVLCPNTVVTVFSVLFPPSGTNYPEATYLWTWYAPLDASGEQSQPRHLHAVAVGHQQGDQPGAGGLLLLRGVQPADRPCQFCRACLLPAAALPGASWLDGRAPSRAPRN
ncbi:hypothetical protein LP419_34490 [Massilia sp. H-1]|nr:hypothetical protein LP419_34490 [Massilia sp. H-1]